MSAGWRGGTKQAATDDASCCPAAALPHAPSPQVDLFERAPGACLSMERGRLWGTPAVAGVVPLAAGVLPCAAAAAASAAAGVAPLAAVAGVRPLAALGAGVRPRLSAEGAGVLRAEAGSTTTSRAGVGAGAGAAWPAGGLGRTTTTSPARCAVLTT